MAETEKMGLRRTLPPGQWRFFWRGTTRRRRRVHGGWRTRLADWLLGFCVGCYIAGVLVYLLIDQNSEWTEDGNIKVTINSAAWVFWLPFGFLGSLAILQSVMFWIDRPRRSKVKIEDVPETATDRLIKGAVLLLLVTVVVGLLGYMVLLTG